MAKPNLTIAVGPLKFARPKSNFIILLLHIRLWH
jgi:hypothetical protein